jgi:hypothetical protein
MSLGAVKERRDAAHADFNGDIYEFTVTENIPAARI